MICHTETTESTEIYFKGLADSADNADVFKGPEEIKEIKEIFSCGKMALGYAQPISAISFISASYEIYKIYLVKNCVYE